MAEELKRKFQNVSNGWVGASVRDGEGKWTALPVEPGGFIWLSEEEERKTAEAPRSPSDNPFIAQWQRPTEFNADNEPIAYETVTGTLHLVDPEERPIASERYTPAQAERSAQAGPAAEEPPAAPQDPPQEPPAPDGDPGEVVGSPEAPPAPQTPPQEGRPAPDEVVGSPDAVPANDAEMAAREARRQREATEQAQHGARPRQESAPAPIGGPPPTGA